jgi:16S rRNA (cytosine967-C5)-methyltransferase
MISSSVAVAERIIRAADREHPADAVLRQELRSASDLSPGQTAAISHAVFAYYRWRGWLNTQTPLGQQIEEAWQLAEAFAGGPQNFPDSELIARAVPQWVKNEMELTAAWARALQEPPKLWLRARRGQGTALAAKLGECRSCGTGPLGDSLEYCGRQDLFRTNEFHAADFELQDISSQAVGIICAAQPGETWWDACAGEGGKLLHLSELMENQGLIWASDRAAWRLQRLKRRAARAKVFNYRAVLWNGGPKLPTKTKFDGILVDAPCSGIGTWQRNPHARWTTTPRDVQELAELQKQLLNGAALAVKPGGKIIYAVCSLARAETEGVADFFEQRFPNFASLRFQNPLALGSPATARTYLWPQQFGGNGMCIAAWTRNPD